MLILCGNFGLVCQKAFEWQTFEAPRTGLASNGRKHLGGLTPPATHALQLVQDMLTPFSPKMVDTSSLVSKSEA